MTRDEMEIWHKLRAACLEIIEGTRKLREHADELGPAERNFYQNMERLLPDAEATMAECQARLGLRTPRTLANRPARPFLDPPPRPVQVFGCNIFVFGSNLAGRHGKGGALEARERWGAEPGVGVGPTGRAYAIPTKDAQLRPLPLVAIDVHVAGFIAYAMSRPDLHFYVTRIGCGLAGYTEAEIRPLFARAPANCEFTWETP